MGHSLYEERRLPDDKQTGDRKQRTGKIQRYCSRLAIEMPSFLLRQWTGKEMGNV